MTTAFNVWLFSDRKLALFICEEAGVSLSSFVRLMQIRFSHPSPETFYNRETNYLTVK